MHDAQIWKSIEALYDEAETVSQSGAPVVAVIKSTPPPVTFQRFNAPKPAATVTQNKTVILTANPAPPLLVVEVLQDANHRDQTATNANSPLIPTTMADIAAAIEQISKAPKNRKVALKEQNVNDDNSQQIIGEISTAVRLILANELPKLVRQAVSASLQDLLTTTTHTVTHGELVVAKKKAVKKATEKKSSPQKTISKKPTVKKAPVTKAELTTEKTNKDATKNTAKKRQ